MSFKGTALTVSNAVLYLTTCLLVGTGLLLELRLDDEDGVRRLVGMGTDDWGEIHLAVALTFVGLTVVHLALNWSWIKAALRQHKMTLMLAGLGVALVMGLLLWPVERVGANTGQQHRQHERSDD